MENNSGWFTNLTRKNIIQRLKPFQFRFRPSVNSARRPKSKWLLWKNRKTRQWPKSAILIYSKVINIKTCWWTKIFYLKRWKHWGKKVLFLEWCSSLDKSTVRRFFGRESCFLRENLLSRQWSCWDLSERWFFYNGDYVRWTNNSCWCQRPMYKRGVCLIDYRDRHTVCHIQYPLVPTYRN